ncbi:MAG TPA: DUF3416 domain-containing protein, partial [Saprospiraceae bacterium]|nr:DUF3416 domain-containing protein [Saprospiraceae bacterium]
MRNRVIIEHVKPEIDNGRYYIKRIMGEQVHVTADIFADGHDVLRASLWYRHEHDKKWSEVWMQDHPNDVWSAEFYVHHKGFYHYKIEAWVDHLSAWFKGFRKKYEDNQQMGVELQIGAQLLRQTAKGYPKTKAKVLTAQAAALEKDTYEHAVETVLSQAFAQLVHDHPMKQFQTEYDNNLRVRVGREKELFSAWYELFPRSTATSLGQHGTFKDVERLLPRIVELGFDVLYLPPIHPIGKLNRKGKNNAVHAEPGEPG